MRVVSCAAMCAALLLPVSVSAQSIGPQQAQALKQQLQDWLSGLLGPSVKLPDLRLRVEGEQDHYKLSWPLSGLGGAGDAAVTAVARPMDGGRWSIEDVQAPPSGSLTVTMPDTAGTPAPGPMKMTFSLGHQDTHGVIDPSLTSSSTFHSELRDVAVTTDSAMQHQEQHLDRWLMDSSLKPAKDGRFDLVSDTTMEGWKSAAKLQAGTPIAFGAQTIHAIGELNGVNRDKVGGLIAAAGGLIGTLPQDAMTKGAHGDIPPAAMVQLHLMVAALHDLVGSVSLEETMDGVQIEIAGMGGLTIKHLLFGFGGEAPDGKLRAWIDIGVDGLDSPTLPPKIAAYLPRHFEIKPSLSGVQTADILKLAADATDGSPDESRLAPDLSAVLSNGASLGVETLAFDLGPAKFSGTGHAVMLSPDSWRGESRITATGLDKLVTEAQGNPDMAQAVPILIMARGLAKPDGDHLVWDVVSDDGKLTINGMDLSALGGGDKGSDKPQQPPRGKKRSQTNKP